MVPQIFTICKTVMLGLKRVVFFPTMILGLVRLRVSHGELTEPS